MYSELIGTRYYNVKNDEFMKNDLYTKTSTKILNPFYEFITADFILRTIYANNLPRTENVKSKKPQYPYFYIAIVFVSNHSAVKYHVGS